MNFPELDDKYQLYIGGEWRDASDGGTFTAKCPADGRVLAQCAAATKEDVDEAVGAAWEAWDEWKKTTPAERSKALNKIADLIDEFIPQLHKIAKGNAAKKIILFGHSLGGHLATLYSQHHQIITIGIATGNIGLRYWDLKGKINILKAATVFNVMILKDGFLAGYKVGFGNKEAKSLMRDWSKTIFTGNYKHISGKNESVSSNQALFIQLKNDHFAPLPSTLGLSKYFTNPDIITLDLTSDIQGNQHSAWIKQPELIVTTIKNWLQKH